MRTFVGGASFLTLCLLSATSAVELPNVKLLDCQGTPLSAFDKCLDIKFASLHEYAGLTKVEGSRKVFEGQLFDHDWIVNADSRVSFTVHNPKKAFVMIHDPSDEELYKLKVNLKTGKTEIHIIPKNIKFQEPLGPHELPGDESVRQVPVNRAVLPSQGFKMTMQIVIDKAFTTKFGANSQETVNAILVHAKTYFAHTQSLTTKLELNVLPIITIEESLPVTGANLNKFGEMVSDNAWPNAQSYSLLTNYGGGGAVGLAWLRASCASSKGSRTNLNAYYDDEMYTAETLVHEVGHNLGMKHDFNGSPSNKRYTDVGNQLCTGVDGYMDYYNEPNKWSPCSVQDFTNYYNSVLTSQGEWCMPLLTTTTTTTTTTQAPVTTTTTTQAPVTTTPTSGCPASSWIGDGYCDDRLNTAECQFDGNDCCFRNRKDWNKYCKECKCQAGTSGCKKSTWYFDKWCDDMNNTPECHYDGGDCCVQRRSDYKKYCTICECKKPAP